MKLELDSLMEYRKLTNELKFCLIDCYNMLSEDKYSKELAIKIEKLLKKTDEVHKSQSDVWPSFR